MYRVLCDERAGCSESHDHPLTLPLDAFNGFRRMLVLVWKACEILCFAVKGDDAYGPCEAEWEVMEKPWIALQSQLNRDKEQNGSNLPHPVTTITVTGNFGGCDMSTEICQAAYRNIMAAGRQMAQRMLGKASSNGRTNWPPTNFKPLFCTGDAIAAKGASIALDAVGTVPGLNDAVGLGTGIVGAGIAAADHEDPGISAASAGAGLALTTGHMAGVAMLGAKMVPVVGNVISGLTGLYDIYGAYKAYQNCIASSKYD